MLILYDIDMTLLETDHVGIGIMERVGAACFGEGFTTRGVEFGGCLDVDIIKRLLTHNGVEPTIERVDRVREGYRDGLAALGSGWARPLGGAMELLAYTMSMDERPTIGLLTGNFPETGAIKLRAAGYDPGVFEVCAWGDDAPFEDPKRHHLPPVAMDRMAERGTPIADPASVLIIGDTVHDVACARAHGCTVLGVATGHHTGEQLKDAGADRVVENLSDTRRVGAWIRQHLGRFGERSASAPSTR